MHLLLFVLQEESNVKPEERGPPSRFGPRNNEELTNASKQVRTHMTCEGQASFAVWVSMRLCSYLTFPSGRDWWSSKSGSTEASTQEIPSREPEPGERTSTCHAIPSLCQTCAKVSKHSLIQKYKQVYYTHRFDSMWLLLRGSWNSYKKNYTLYLQHQTSDIQSKKNIFN